MPIVLFKTTSTYRDAITNPVFQEGRAYQMSDDFANRWTRRGVACIITDYKGEITPDPRIVQINKPLPVTEVPVTEVPVSQPIQIGKGRWGNKK